MNKRLTQLIPFGRRRRRRLLDPGAINQALPVIGGVGLGAGLMFLFDPNRGNRRRAVVRDKTTHALNKTGAAIGATARDFGHRARGLAAKASSPFRRGAVTDEVLVERVRSKTGRIVSHPHAIEVRADEGRVTLAGPILASEVDDLLKQVARVRGVDEVENRLEVHDQPGDTPALQGGRRRPGEQFELRQSNWSPAARVLTGVGGSALIAWGIGRRGLLGTALATAGAGMLARAATNLESKRLLGIKGGRRAIDLQKTINIDAPVEVVYDFWSKYENFPRFMTNVLEVSDKGNGQSHWVVAGPAGVPVEWDAVITERIPNRVLAWKSVPGSQIGHAGLVRFDPDPRGGTRVNIRLSYNPVAGAIGHGVATLFGANPKRKMDEDLMRMKTLIEGGNPPPDAAQRPGSSRAAHSS